MSQAEVEFAPPKDAGLFGGALDLAAQDVILIGVPWEPTVSYGRGTSQAPAQLVPASHQLDVFEAFLNRDFLDEVGMLPLEPDWEAWNQEATEAAMPIIENGGRLEGGLDRNLARVNELSARLNDAVEAKVEALLALGKTVGILGGDHSSPLGAIRALAKRYPGIGILHVDAHHDLREAYEGFKYSHASIMFNALAEAPGISRLVSVGIRDFSRDEAVYAAAHGKVISYYERNLQERQFEGESWAQTCQEIMRKLPHEVYVSFDIDGMDPNLCPSTGTPVPGGLSFAQSIYLLEAVVKSGRKILGFDLCEVGVNQADEWDLNVGARVLHKLAALAYCSRSLS